MSTQIDTLLSQAIKGQRINEDDALYLLENASLHELAFAAHQIRLRLHPENMVTYVADRNINYSNICSCACKFCAFYKAENETGAYVIKNEELAQKIEETIALGGTQILMQGGHHPNLPFSFYEDMLTFIKNNWDIHIHAFSPPEIIYFTELYNRPLEDILKSLQKAGLQSIPGGGAEILVDSVRTQVSPNKCSRDKWLSVMEKAHELGMKTTATMMFGHVEEKKDIIEHLSVLRILQDKTKGFTAFIPWTFQPDNTALKSTKATSVEYLKVLAISRIMLDNFDNIQVSWVTMGADIAQLALFHGGNDFGSLMIEENVVKAAGVSYSLSREHIHALIADAGFSPQQRTMDYSLITMDYTLIANKK